MRDLFIHAREHGYAVEALDVVSLDFLEGVIRAAENYRTPVIVSLAEPNFELLMAATVAACRRSSALPRGGPAHGRRALPLLLAHQLLLRTGDRCLPEPSRPLGLRQYPLPSSGRGQAKDRLRVELNHIGEQRRENLQLMQSRVMYASCLYFSLMYRSLYLT